MRGAQRLRAELGAAPQGDTVAEFVGRSVLQVFDDPDREVVRKKEDITESKRAEETLRESEERFRWMAATLTEARWIMALQPEQILVCQSER